MYYKYTKFEYILLFINSYLINCQACVIGQRTIFIAFLRRLFGATPYNYILQLKMNETIRLLSYSNLTISEIAHETGYNDVAYFTRAFSKYFDISPGRFRNSLEKRVP